MRAFEHRRAVVVGSWVWLGACGPVIDLDGLRGTTGSSGQSTESSTEASGTAGSGGTSSGSSTASQSGPGTTMDVDVDDSQILDVGWFDLPPPPHDRPMYASCWDDGECLPGLECVTLAYGKDIQYSICTTPCVDPALDCDVPPAGWAATCALDLSDGQSTVCAIACNPAQECPAGSDPGATEVLGWLNTLADVQDLQFTDSGSKPCTLATESDVTTIRAPKFSRPTARIAREFGVPRD